jgi:hypothetical protein
MVFWLLICTNLYYRPLISLGVHIQQLIFIVNLVFGYSDLYFLVFSLKKTTKCHTTFPTLVIRNRVVSVSQRTALSLCNGQVFPCSKSQTLHGGKQITGFLYAQLDLLPTTCRDCLTLFVIAETLLKGMFQLQTSKIQSFL